jgi:WD40 repeat protein
MRSALAALVLAIAGIGVAAGAAREPVLKSIAAPHSYYWRELYLPQLTSGPSSATFSPDGRELIYSRAGSLWRQPIDPANHDDSVELTRGPGYDYQPDWSRDGRWVVFARHDHDAIELWALDLSNRVEHRLTETAAVNVEPRFSPDGKRLAFVTTREGGQFNVWTARFEDGKLEAAAPLLPLRESRVKRYYYAPTDHVINPSWSPDGKDLYVVTNREVAWGTGDIWSVPVAAPETAERLIREETSWAARPELSPDGKRLLYSSYHGRQTHQLWLASRDGDSPMPLTFGELGDFDRRNARWSPDGRRVLYVSNENGNTSLWVQEVVGGARLPIEAPRRRYLRPMATLSIAIHDEAGKTVPARVGVLAADGRHYGPDDAWMHADDYFDRTRQTHEDHYFHCPGDCRVTAPQGRLTVRVQHGLAYLPVERTLDLGDEPQTIDIRLTPNQLPASFGASWISADLHVHMNYGGTYRHTPATLARVARAEDLDVIENLAVNKEQRIPDLAWFGTPPFEADGVTIFEGQEHHSSYWGHLGLLHLRRFLLPDFAAYRHSGFASPYPHDGVIADLARAQGGLVGYVHPYDWKIVPEREKSLSHTFPADVALGKVDYFEVASFSDPLSNDDVWHRILNLGFRVPAGAGTDAMANYASLRGPVGLDRIFLPLLPLPSNTARGEELLATAIQAGRGFVTNGPLLGLRIEGSAAGDEIRLDAPRSVRFEAAVRSIAHLDHIEILVNGKAARSFQLTDGKNGDFAGEIPVESSGWIALRAYADGADPWIADLYPYGHTNPIWIEVGGRPARSIEDARYFVRWIERVIEDATARDDYNDDAERKATLQYLGAARAVFLEKAAERAGEP